MKVKSDHCSEFSNLSNWKEEAWKNQGFNAIRTRDLTTISVQCSTNWAMKSHIGSEVILLHSYLPWGVKWREVYYEILHICTAVHCTDESEEWSSEWIFQLKQLERKSLKKSGLQRDSNPWPPWYRCNMLYQLSHEAIHREWGQFIEFISAARSEMTWSIYEIIHTNQCICTAVVDESEEWSSQWVFQFKRLERRSLKKISVSRVQIPLKPWFFQASSFQLF